MARAEIPRTFNPFLTAALWMAAAVAAIVIYGAVTLFAPSPAQATHVLVPSR